MDVTLTDSSKPYPGAPAGTNAAGATFNGQRANQDNFILDGQTFIDSGSNTPLAYRISLEAIAEVKTSTTGQTTEFGRNSGAQIQVATRSGTRNFHGGGYFFKRHEGWNVNTFTNNRDRIERQLNRDGFGALRIVRSSEALGAPRIIQLAAKVYF
jgi:hypothetical protein